MFAENRTSRISEKLLKALYILKDLNNKINIIRLLSEISNFHKIRSLRKGKNMLHDIK